MTPDELNNLATRVEHTKGSNDLDLEVAKALDLSIPRDAAFWKDGGPGDDFFCWMSRKRLEKGKAYRYTRDAWRQAWQLVPDEWTAKLEMAAYSGSMRTVSVALMRGPMTPSQIPTGTCTGPGPDIVNRALVAAVLRYCAAQTARDAA